MRAYGNNGCCPRQKLVLHIVWNARKQEPSSLAAVPTLAVPVPNEEGNTNDLSYHTVWDVMAHWLRRLLSTGGSWVRLPLWPSRRDLGQVLYLQLPVRFGMKLRYSIRAVVGSASE